VYLVIHVSYLLAQSINLFHNGKGFAEHRKTRQQAKKRTKDKKEKVSEKLH
jgi:hypothetical protein